MENKVNLSEMSEVMELLKKPFPPKELDVRGMMHTQDGTKAVPFFYLTARAVMDRLDVAFQGQWILTTDLIYQNDVKVVVKATISCMNKGILIERSGIGEADILYKKQGDTSRYANEPFKSAESDAIKRAGVGIGIGRYLYDIPQIWLPWTGDTMWGHFVNDPRDVIFNTDGTIKTDIASPPKTSSSFTGSKPEESASTAAIRASKAIGQSTGTKKNVDRNTVTDELIEYLTENDYSECLRDTLSETCVEINTKQKSMGLSPMSDKQMALIINLSDQLGMEYPDNLLYLGMKDASPIIKTLMDEVKR